MGCKEIPGSGPDVCWCCGPRELIQGRVSRQDGIYFPHGKTQGTRRTKADVSRQLCSCKLVNTPNMTDDLMKPHKAPRSGMVFELQTNSHLQFIVKRQFTLESLIKNNSYQGILISNQNNAEGCVRLNYKQSLVKLSQSKIKF